MTGDGPLNHVTLCSWSFNILRFLQADCPEDGGDVTLLNLALYFAAGHFPVQMMSSPSSPT